MNARAMTVGCYEYDTTRALFDRTVTFDGIDATFESEPVISDIFDRMVRTHDFDVAELGWTFYLRTLDLGAPFIAIPAFPNRLFRHSCIFVNAASGITGPRDLAGRTIGEFGMYGQDSGVWAKGILMDEYGFRPEQCRWVIGGVDRPMEPFDFVPQRHPANVEVGHAPEGRSLAQMLETGEIDALFTANVPRRVLDGSPHITRLFPDVEPIERDYYRRTGIFPANHTVVLPRQLVDANPGLAGTVYRGFLDAKNVAADRYRESRKIYEVNAMIPWMNALFEENSRLLPDDWWPYGVSANRTMIDTFLRYHFEQGLSERRWTVEEVFAPELLDT